MKLYAVTAPEAEPLTVAEAKAHCRIDDSDSDTMISSLIAAARHHIDGRDGWLGRALVEQTWDLKFDGGFPGCIGIPLPPLRSVTSITYVDGNGDTQTLAPASYRVLGADGWGPGRIEPSYGLSWPSTRAESEAVTVRFVCGYAPDESASPTDYGANIPAPIRQAMLLMIGDLYEQRESVVVGVQAAKVPMSTTVEALLMPFKVWTF